MLKISDKNIPTDLQENFIIGIPKLVNSSIQFNVKNNYVIFDNNGSLLNSNICFLHDNAILFINTHHTKINANLGFAGVIYVGKNVIINDNPAMHVCEGNIIIIGDIAMIGAKVTLWTTDHHQIFDTDTKERINHGGNIIIGDHVWLGRKYTILKNSVIGSGSIIGYAAVVSGKSVESNSIYAGVPAKLVRKNIFWTRKNITNQYSD